MNRSQSVWFGTTLLLALTIKGTLCNDNNFYIRSNQIGASQRHRRQQTNVFDQDQSDTTVISSRQSQVTSCELNSNGYYGTIDTTSDIYDIQYLYQVSVVSGTTSLQLSTDIIRPLDFAITTAILPKFFDCSRRLRVEERLLQDNGTIFAITSTPIDTYISSDRLPCPKVIANSDCYVVQGLSTAIATGFRDADVVSAAFQDAVNAVLQENTIVPNLGISTIIDVTALADTTDVAPPVNIQPQTPIPVSSSVPILAPITNPPIATPVASPGPVDTRSPITITFAPIPSIPPAPMPNILNLPSISTPIAPSISIPITPSIAPTIKPDSNSTSSDVPSAVPTMPMDDETTTSPTKMNVPVNTDEDNTLREESSNEKDGLKWWAWILIVLGILCVIFCGYSVWTNRDITTAPPSGDRSDIGSSTVGILSSNPTKQSSRNKDSSISNKKGKLGKSNNNNDPHDTEDDEEIPYEPPPGMDLYVPPPSTFTNNDTNTSNNNNNNQNTSSSNRDYHITAPPIPPAPPLFSNPTPVLVTPPAFINDDNNDDDDEDDDDDDDEEEIEYERDENDDDGEYTDDEDEVEGEEHNYHHNNNDGDDEVFEDEESYYEEEEDDDEDYVDDDGAYRNTSNTNEWGDKSPSFGELY